MDLEDIMQMKEVSPIRTHTAWFPLGEIFKIVQLIEGEKRMVLTGGGGRKRGVAQLV